MNKIPSEVKNILEQYNVKTGTLTEEWWYDFFIGVGLKGLSVGTYIVETEKKLT